MNGHLPPVFTVGVHYTGLPSDSVPAHSLTVFVALLGREGRGKKTARRQSRRAAGPRLRETLTDDTAIDEVGAVGVGLGVLQRDVGDLGEGLVGEECLV